jgi:hypothetical protein
MDRAAACADILGCGFGHEVEYNRLEMNNLTQKEENMSRMFGLHGLVMLLFLAGMSAQARAGQVTEADIMAKQVKQEELFETLEPAQIEFVKAYLKALAEADTKGQQALLHPDTRACLEKNKQLDEIYAQRKNAISTTLAKVAFLKGNQYRNAGNFPAEDLYTFAIGHAWFSDIQRYATLVITLVRENGKYYEIIPCS